MDTTQAEREGTLPYYRYRHVVTLADTNIVGNVYFAHHVAWQGKCRELFLRDHAPDVLEELRGSLRLITLRCSCQYFAELMAFDEVEIRMRLRAAQQNRIAMDFEYVVQHAEGKVLAARGDQEIACMRAGPTGVVPCPVPASLMAALRHYQAR